MHIVSASDDRYLPHYGAMLHSARLYNAGLSFHLLDTGIEPANLKLLLDFAKSLDIDLSVIGISDKVRSALPDYAKRAAFGRLFIPQVMPPEMKRVVYMDCDMTVLGSLRDLFSVDLQGCPIGACLDGIPETLRVETETQKFVFNGVNYFNSGMLVIDLPAWREQKVTERVLAFARAYPDRLPFMDQSAFNFELRGQVKFLDRKWNFFKLDEVHTIDVNDIRIVHHTNIERPWENAKNPFCELYRLHRNATPWPLGDPLELPFWQKMRRRKRDILARLGSEAYKRRMGSYRDYDTVNQRIALPAELRASSILAQFKC